MEALSKRNHRMYDEDQDYRSFVDDMIQEADIDANVYWHVLDSYSNFVFLLDQNLSNAILKEAGKEPIYGYPETNPALKERAEGKGSEVISYNDIEKSDKIVKDAYDKMQ